VSQRITGRYVSISTTGEVAEAYVPAPLPLNPPLQINADLHQSMIQAALELGRLDSLTASLPDRPLFLYFFVRKEAVLSSQIEGTQSSLSDLLMFENELTPGVPLEDVREVSRYVNALEYGLMRLREGFPLSLRLIREMHARLMVQEQGVKPIPSEFRRVQNWIGGTRPGNARYVPPPPEYLIEAMGALEKFVHDEPERTPTLVKTALIHAQFESIHPFLDGNGRTGRLLIPLMLCAENILSEPLLYISLFFKTYREEYYNRLQAIRTHGDWEGWVAFFIEGIRATAAETVAVAKALATLQAVDRNKIRALGRTAGTVFRVYDSLAKHIAITIPKTAVETDLNFNTVKVSLRRLSELQIAKEITGHSRNKVFIYSAYAKLMDSGFEKSASF